MTTPPATQIAQPELTPHSRLGPYRIVRLLGRGGMGAVYEAEHTVDGRIVALKLLTLELDKMDSRERFLREGQIAATINHPNAVYIYGTEEIDGTPAITMELVPGGTLEERVTRDGPMPVDEAIDSIIQVIDGLDAAHAAGVLHRDVKPSNCFVGVGGAVKIGDFGLSKPVDGGEQQKLTQTGVFLGTPIYSSPEQLLGETLDARSDIYAVGVTLYYLLTGRLPYTSGSMMQVVAAVLNGVPAPMTAVRADLPPAVVDVVMKAIARKPADRYQDYTEFRAAVVALRATDVAAATLWDRFRASIVDGLALVIIGWVITSTIAPGLSSSSVAARNGSGWPQVFLSLALTLLVIGVPEGLRGASIGKWMLGIRVIGPNGLAPGLARAEARIVVLALSDFATLLVQGQAATPGQKAAYALLGSIVFRGLYLVTIRRHNGWRMVHDIATGTRVVRPRPTLATRRGDVQRAVAPTLTGAESRLGPYILLGPVGEGSQVQRGWDAAVKRAVWILPRAAGVAELSAARRSLARLTRMRWVGGRRLENDSWDAFEAPLGEPLAERLTRPVPWTVQRNWLVDLCAEFIAAGEDGTHHTSLAVDRLWVTPNDRVVVPEGTDGGDGEPDPMALIRAVVQRVAAAPASDTPSPGHATRAIAAIAAAATPRDVLAILNDTVGRPVAITRTRRAGLLAATVGPMIVLAALGAFSVTTAVKVDTIGFKRTGLLEFITDSTRNRPDTVAARRGALERSGKWSDRLTAALRRLGAIAKVRPDTITPPDTLRAQRRLAAVYLVHLMPLRRVDSTTRGSNGTFAFTLSAADQRRLDTLTARTPKPDTATAHAAHKLVDSVWKGAVPGNTSGSVLPTVACILGWMTLALFAAFAIGVGVFARRGPMLRGFQVEFVTVRGEPAGRARILLRNAVSWSVIAVPLLILWLMPSLSAGALATTLVVAIVLTVFAWVFGVAYAVRHPSRGIAERVSGMWMVPE